MRILIASDACEPQVNGVVRTVAATARELQRLGHEVLVLTGAGLPSLPVPTYPEIRLAVLPGGEIARRIDAFAPDAIHIATEATVGIAARTHCLRTRRAFTTAWHTQLPEYVHARCRLPLVVSYAWLRRFHAPAAAVLCGTPRVIDRLRMRGFTRLALWSRGVDGDLFVPAPRRRSRRTGPVFLYVGRLAVEKNVAAFLELDLPGTRWVVGDGPARRALERRYPDAHFFGTRKGRELAGFYQQADVLVFPSRTDTFGLVMAEAMACGTPVAAFPVAGPLDVVTDARAGVLDEDLAAAARRALDLDRAEVARFASRYSWKRATEAFLSYLVPAEGWEEGSRCLPRAADL